MKVRILLADDHQIIIEGLRALLEKHSEVEVLAETDNGREAVKLARNLAPDVVVMDVAMPDLNGIDATRQILSENPKVKVIALSMYSKRQFIVKMLEAGAVGYLLKDCAFQELANAIRTVTNGDIYLGQQVSSVAVQDYVNRLRDKKTDEKSQLSQREREVLQLIAEGLLTKEIAQKLNISGKTVETHRRNIMKKLEIDRVADLTKYAIREGITFLDN